MSLSLQRYMRPDCSNSSLIKLSNYRSEKKCERSIGIAIENGVFLHESVIIEILSWLSVKDLLQYKSVCKSWYAIISSTDFMSKHLENYYKNNDDGHDFLLTQYYLNLVEIQLFVMLVDETPRVLAHENLSLMPMYSSKICGPCDGLYYIYTYEFPEQRAIWNPAINELKILPLLITKTDPPLKIDGAGEVYGFGFDSLSRDYKVVVIKGYLNTEDHNIYYPESVYVYSLSNDSWKYCGDLSQWHIFDVNRCYNFVNGCCYWSESDYGDGDYKSCGAIISFNLSMDAFEEISLPDYKQPTYNSLGIYDDSLALLIFNQDDKFLEIWALKERIWTMKFRGGPFPTVGKPIGHWMDNKIILETENGYLVLLDPVSQDLKDLGFQSGRWCEGIFAWKESLVSVKGESSCAQAVDHNVKNKRV